MKNHKGDFRGFYHFSESWYRTNPHAPGFVDDVHFGWYSPDGGTSGEMAMEWTMLGGKPVPQIQAFSDSWDLFATMADVFKALAERDEQDIAPKEFCALLLELGFKDKTQRNDPNVSRKSALKQQAIAKLTAEELGALGIK